MIGITFHFNHVKQIDTNILEKCSNAGVLTLYDGKIGTGSELTLFFDNPEQIQIFVNALVDLFLKMSAQTQTEQADPDSANGIKPILIEQIEEETNG